MYVPGALIVAAGLVQLALASSARRAGKTYRGRGVATS